MIKTIEGVKYLRRDQRPVKELRRLYAAYQKKYPASKVTIHQWLVYWGKVYLKIRNP